MEYFTALSPRDVQGLSFTRYTPDGHKLLACDGVLIYTRDRPVRAVTIHATHDKAHILNGYCRYTADGTLISETRSVGIRIYKAGHWGSAGSLGQVTHHDRSNSTG